MKFVMFYEMAPDAMSKIMTHFPAHKARLDEFHARGALVGDPPEGAMGIFNSKEDAEKFIEGDPFVTNGLVAKHRIVVWKAAFL
jgi:uncharacterized protein YciI